MNPFVCTFPDRKNFCHAFRRSTYRRGIFLCALVLVLAVLGSRAAYATTYTVTDTTDNAADTGSLRYAVNTAVDGDTINFLNVIGTITLTNGTMTITHSITITGPGAGLLTISGSGNGSVVAFRINAGTVAISGLTIANSNTVFSGGGGFVGGAFYNGATLTLSDCNITNNTAGDGGGAIGNQGTLTVDNCIIYGNTANQNVGGGIENSGTLIVENSTVSGNTTNALGGGIYNSGTMTVENSTIYGNASAGGGGIYSNDGIGTASVTMENATVYGNTASSDGGIGNNASTLTVTNSIVAGNTGGDCSTCSTTGNLIGGTPQLGPLQYNGGMTETMIPLPGSPAIGAGSSSTLSTDQRGFARPTSGASDLGAVQTNYLTVTTLTDSTDTTTCTGGATCSLRDAMDDANTTGSGDIIFQSGLTGTINVGSTLPSIVTSHVNIAGPGANLLTVSGGGGATNYQVLDVSGVPAVVNLRGLNVANGNSMSYAGGLSNSGLLTVENSAFSSNAGGDGGGVFNDGSLILENTTFANNYATEGAGILNQGTLIAVNSTFNGNRAYNSNGGGVGNPGGTALLYNSTLSGNDVLNGGVGGGVYSTGSLLLENDIVSGNTNLQSNTADDCSGCGTQGPANLIGGMANLGSLAYNGLNATVRTLVPLPGSAVIRAGDPTQLLAGVTTDERGFPRLTAGKLDLGAAQTNYTAVQFVQQPTNTALNTDISPAVTVEVLETNGNLAAPNNTDPVDGIPITLTFAGTGTLAGTLTQTTTGGVATYADLNGNTVGTGDTLATSVTVTPVGVTPPQTLTATSTSFDITLVPTTVNFNPPLPASVTYGVSPLTLKATAYSGGTPTGQTITFQVDSGPATVSGNVLTITGAGTVVVEVDAAANSTYAASDAITTLTVTKASSNLTLTASANHITPGASVTLTATATSATTGTPTGMVTFTSGSMQLGTATLNQGVATLAVTTLPVGSNTITASYAGDTNFTGSQALLNGTIVVGNPSFNMTVNPVTLTIQRGYAGVATVTLTPVLGYSGTVSLSCSTLPQNSSCHFQPQSVTLNGSGNPIQVTLAIQIGTPAQSRTGSVARLRPIHPLRGLPVLPAMFFWLPGARPAFEDEDKARDQNTTAKPKSKSSAMLWMIALLVLSASLLGVIGCADMSPNNPPPGQQTVTVVALGSGGINQSAGIQVTIQ